MEQLFALHFFILDRVPTINQRQEISSTSISDKLTQLKKSKTVSENRKISKIPVVVLFIDCFAKNPDNSPLSEAWLPGTRIKYLLLHNTLSFIKPITNKALKHHWIRNDFPLKSKRSDFKKGED